MLTILIGLYVLDSDAEVEGAPGAPLDVRCLDANKDYIIVTWKQPAVDGGNSILGYFVDRSVIDFTLPQILEETVSYYIFFYKIDRLVLNSRTLIYTLVLFSSL